MYTNAEAMNHELSMKLGLNPRHLDEDASQLGHALDAVMSNIHAAKVNRRLQASTQASLNWCSTNNPKGRSVCADVKSQSTCGSCWAFAATDVIETAVSMASGAPAVSLSSQQLISCSTSRQTDTFTYCFANSGNVPSWLQPTMKWESQNQGCNGGMTHIAFSDAAYKIKNLATRLSWPYKEAGSISSNSDAPVGPATIISRGTSTVKESTSSYNQCGADGTYRRPDAETAAHIEGWVPAFNATSCALTKNPAELLKMALQNGPLAVALSARGPFKSYKSGIYSCPVIASGDMIDHAVVLVGYGYEKGLGYWILKNSYGAEWGQQGFFNLVMDDMVNCGLNVFPIRVMGASSGPAANAPVDGGGNLTFAGMSMSTWIVIGAFAGAASIIVTIFGVIMARKRMANL